MTASTAFHTIAARLPDKIAIRFLSPMLAARPFIWILLTALVLLFTLGVSLLSPCQITLYLPLISLIGIGLVVHWKGLGVSIAYLFLAGLGLFTYQKVPIEAFFWQMGILFSLAINFYIALLSSEEVSSLFFTLKTQAEEKETLLLKALDEQKAANEKWKEEKEALDEEIKRWKEEAEQRKIEKKVNEKQLSLIQTEIEFLTQQKESLIEETQKANILAIEKEKLAERALQEKASVSSSFVPLQEENHSLRNENEKLAKTLLEKNTEIIKLKQALSEQENDSLKVSEQLNLFEETTRSLKKHELELQHELGSLRSETEMLKKEHFKLAQDLTALQEVKTHLENQVSELLSKQALPIVEIPVDSEELVQLKREKARAEGLYHQLRSQFEEKTATLAQTRKELFQVQGKLLAIEQENTVESPEFTAPLKGELELFRQEWMLLNEENSRLEEEISKMETVISQLLKEKPR